MPVAEDKKQLSQVSVILIWNALLHIRFYHLGQRIRFWIIFTVIPSVTLKLHALLEQRFSKSACIFIYTVIKILTKKKGIMHFL